MDGKVNGYKLSRYKIEPFQLGNADPEAARIVGFVFYACNNAFPPGLQRHLLVF
jgi:hypothetical protein